MLEFNRNSLANRFGKLKAIALAAFTAAVIAAPRAMAAAGPASLPNAGTAAGNPPAATRNVAGIVTHSGGHVVQIGTAFFVAVPSEAVPGSSFIYLVTAHHNLLDDEGQPRTGLFLTLEDAKTGAMREQALPPETQWVLDPKDTKADVAAIPLRTSGASIAPIPLSSLLGADDPYAHPETGAQVYYLTAATVDAVNPRFEALARFGHVSVPGPARTEVTGAGLQELALLDGGGTPGFSSGAPVFASLGLHFALWGILEANTSLTHDPVFAGLAGILPARYIDETVKAMAAVQDKALRARKHGG
ncbi:MAG: hypothetical protein ACREQI_08460 [Candidatus Binataceae bacterium]